VKISELIPNIYSYRVTQNINPPFSIIAVVTESGKKVDYNIKVKANFPSKIFATSVIVKIPTPKNTAKQQITAKSGRTKYDPTTNCILWKFRKFTGSTSFDLVARVELISTLNDKQWSRPPITMDFQVPMFTASGMHVRFLKVTEKSNYDTVKWVRYITKAGSYQVRI
jgi:AP-2 complex subunit mu-1